MSVTNDEYQIKGLYGNSEDFPREYKDTVINESNFLSMPRMFYGNNNTYKIFLVKFTEDCHLGDSTFIDDCVKLTKYLCKVDELQVYVSASVNIQNNNCCVVKLQQVKSSYGRKQYLTLISAKSFFEDSYFHDDLLIRDRDHELFNGIFRCIIREDNVALDNNDSFEFIRANEKPLKKFLELHADLDKNSRIMQLLNR